MTSMAARLAGALLAASLVTACSDTGGDTGSGAAGADGTTTGSGTASGSATVDPNLAYGLEVPAGVQLTPQGSTLEVGDTATVAWQPWGARAGKVGVLSIRVTKLRQATLKDFRGFTLDERSRTSTPYYVGVSVTNEGATDLSLVQIPLYVLDGNNTLLEQSGFTSRFKPCESKPLPKPFRPGARVSTCLVYLAYERGSLEGVTFRPTQEYAPITWTGAVEKPARKQDQRKGTAAPSPS